MSTFLKVNKNSSRSLELDELVVEGDFEGDRLVVDVAKVNEFLPMVLEPISVEVANARPTQPSLGNCIKFRIKTSSGLDCGYNVDYRLAGVHPTSGNQVLSCSLGGAVYKNLFQVVLWIHLPDFQFVTRTLQNKGG